MKNYLFFIYTLLCSSVVWSQDPHFSQFTENPSLINPALTGADGMRASITSKNQWRSITTPYKTQGFSVEARNSKVKKRAGMPSNLENVPPSEKVPGKYAGGLSYYTDRAGDGRLVLNQLNLSLATFVQTGEKSHFSFGLQTSLATRKIKTDNFIYPNQFNGATYDVDMNSGEYYATEKFRYFDMGTGILYSYNDEQRGLNDHKEVKGHLGFAAYHLTSPKQKFTSPRSDKLYMKLVSHGDLLMSIPSTRTAIFTAYLFQLQATSIEVTAGGMFRYYLKNDTRYTGYIKRTTIGGGLSYRYRDAVIISGLYEWQEQWAVQLSYDVNVSKLAKASHIRGGFEITMRYTSGHPYLYQKLK